MDTPKYTLRDILEMLSDDNRYYASQALKRHASAVECVLHWISNHPVPPHITTFEVEDDDQGWLFV